MITYSIIQKSQLEGAHRLDAEYYQPEYLRLDLLKNFSPVILKNVARCFSGFAFPSGEFSHSDGIPVVKMTEIVGDGFVDLTNAERVSFEFCKKNQTTCNKVRGQIGDIVVALTGATIGKVGVLLNSEPLINQRVLLCRAKTISWRYLWILLSSDLFRDYIWRGALGGAQPNVSPQYATDFLTPVLEKFDIQKVEQVAGESILSDENSKSLYSQAENLLLEELGLKNFNSDDDWARIVNFSDIKSAGRIDAEYFQVKYEKLLKKIKEKNGRVLEELVSIKKGIEPGADSYLEEGKKFIRVSNMSKFGISGNDQKYVSEDLYKKLQDGFEPKIGEILLTKDATPGIASVVRENADGIIASGIVRLKLKNQDIEDEYVALCLNSIVGQMQAERDAGGSVIAHWKPEQIKNVLIPVLSKPIQQKIAVLVRKSHDARKKAKELLEEAKQKVEEMIEK